MQGRIDLLQVEARDYRKQWLEIDVAQTMIQLLNNVSQSELMDDNSEMGTSDNLTPVDRSKARMFSLE